jgi:hypothetical protein
MAVTQIKRGASKPTNEELDNYQLGLDTISGDFYVNNNGVITYIGGNTNNKDVSGKIDISSIRESSTPDGKVRQVLTGLTPSLATSNDKITLTVWESNVVDGSTKEDTFDLAVSGGLTISKGSYANPLSGLVIDASNLLKKSSIRVSDGALAGHADVQQVLTGVTAAPGADSKSINFSIWGNDITKEAGPGNTRDDFALNLGGSLSSSVAKGGLIISDEALVAEVEKRIKTASIRDSFYEPGKTRKQIVTGVTVSSSEEDTAVISIWGSDIEKDEDVKDTFDLKLGEGLKFTGGDTHEITIDASGIRQEIKDAELATRKWLPAVTEYADLPTATTTGPNNGKLLVPGQTYLIKVRAGGETVEGVYEGIWNETNTAISWSFYDSSQHDYVDQAELSSALTPITAAASALNERVTTNETNITTITANYVKKNGGEQIANGKVADLSTKGKKGLIAVWTDDNTIGYTDTIDEGSWD